MSNIVFRIVINFIIIFLVGLGTSEILEIMGSPIYTRDKLILSFVVATLLSIFIFYTKKNSRVSSKN